MDPGDREERSAGPDPELRVLTRAYLAFWTPLGLAMLVALLTGLLNDSANGGNLLQPSLRGSTLGIARDVLMFVTGLLALYTLIFWIASFVAAPTILVFRTRRRLEDKMETPEKLWLLVFGPLLACPAVFVVSFILAIPR